MRNITSSAIAASVLLGCGVASAARIQIDERTALEIEGTIEFAIVNQEEEVTEGGVTRVERRTEGRDIDSTVQFDGEHIISDELTPCFRAQFNFEADEDIGDGFNDTESAFIGVEHERYGRVWGPFDDGFYDDWINDAVADEFEVEDPSSPSDSDIEDALLLQTPTFFGLTLGGAVSFKGGEDNPEFEPNVDEDPGLETAFQVAARYEWDIYTVAVAFDSLGTQPSDDVDPLIGGIATVDVSPFLLGVRAEYQGDSDDGVDDDQLFLGLGLGYDYGVGTIYGVVNRVEAGDDVPDGDRTEFVWRASYILGTVEFYLENGFFDRDDELGDFVAIGFEYGF